MSAVAEGNAGLTSGRLLARNSLLNLAGQGAPMLLALLAFPLLLRHLGTERFGILTLAWMAIGYFSVFDLGLGRALTQLVAERLGREGEREIPRLILTALSLTLLLGALGALAFLLFSPWLVERVLRVPEALQAETRWAFYLLALSLPLVISTAALRGVLEAQQRFGMVNAVRFPLGAFTFLGPLAVLPFSSSLVPIVAVLVAGRSVAWLAHLLLCFRTVPTLRTTRLGFEKRLVAPMLRFGGWMTVSNLVSPLMTYLDRFLIAAWISITAVAYYVTPYEVVTRLWLIPAALLGVLFPAFANSFVQDRVRARLLFDRTVRVVFLAVFPLTLLLVALAPEGLELWLGPEFARNSTRVLQWLAIGVFINSVAMVPFAAIQGFGRPDLTAKLHLIELPLYLLLLAWLITRFGIEGAALAWVARVAFDLLVLLGIVSWLLSGGAPLLRRAVAMLGGAVLILAAVMFLPGTSLRLGYLVLVSLAFAIAGWFVILAPEERTLLRSRLRARRRVPPPDSLMDQAAVK